MAGTATVEGGSCRAFEDRHRLDIIRVDRRDTVTEVITAFGSCLTVTRVIHRHTIHYIQRLVITRDLRGTTQYDARRTGSTTCGLLYYQTGHTTGERVSYVDLFSFGQVFTFDLAHLVTQGFAVTFDT